MKRKVALLSEHASPFTVVDSLDRGGHTLYVAQVAHHLAGLGYLVDIFTRKDSQELPEVYNWLDNLRVIHVPAGASAYVREEHLPRYVQEFSEYLIEFFSAQQKPYDLIHASFWRSGWAAAEIKASFGTPFVITFHTLNGVWQRKQNVREVSAGQRFEIENRIVREADGIIARSSQDRQDLISLYNADPAYIAQIPEGFNAPQAGERAEDEKDWQRRRLSRQHSASPLTDFYENVLAVRRVSLPQAEALPLLVGSYEDQTSPGIVEHIFQTTLQTPQQSGEPLGEGILAAANLITECLERGGKIMVCGEGDTALLARQFAAAYAGLPVCLLGANGAALHEQAAEHTQNTIGSQMEVLGQAGDLLVGITAGDVSTQLLEAFRCARATGIHRLRLVDSHANDILSLSDVGLVISVPDARRRRETQRIILHLICELVQMRSHAQPQMSAEDLQDAMCTLSMRAQLVDIQQEANFPAD